VSRPGCRAKSHSTAGVPQGRGKIERFFGTITTELLPRLPGHLSPGSATPATAPQLSLAELDDTIGRFVITDYHARAHTETREAPRERWLANGWLPRMPDSLEQLDLLLLTIAKPRVVQRDGIRFQGVRYLDLTLAAYVGEPVTIRYDPRDLAEIRVYHQGRFLCPAIAPELADHTISLRDLQAAATRAAAACAPNSTAASHWPTRSCPATPHHHPAQQTSDRRTPAVAHASSVTATSSGTITTTWTTASSRRTPAGKPAASAPAFLDAKEHRRFAELADACRRERYIGICYGPPGVGKTLSARHYAAWDQLEPWLDRCHRTGHEGSAAPDMPSHARTALYTPAVGITPSRIHHEVEQLGRRLDYAIDEHLHPTRELFRDPPERSYAELLIVDEADRVKTTALEALRDFFDRRRLGLILIGMPGLEKRLARYPQLCSRIGFAHQYRPLSADELRFVLTHHWRTLGLELAAEDFTDTEAIATVARITNGNFRLVNRLFSQIRRVLEINSLTTITREVIETAREGLVIGQP
jgi:DNA transposition AAA+ family ATPase